MTTTMLRSFEMHMLDLLSHFQASPSSQMWTYHLRLVHHLVKGLLKSKGKRGSRDYQL
uniref:Uncharacterized protein n=1 Tax=Arundo donax TaxID=35708 RepID=A0A0A9FS40_ARUDO